MNRIESEFDPSATLKRKFDTISLVDFETMKADVAMELTKKLADDGSIDIAIVSLSNLAQKLLDATSYLVSDTQDLQGKLNQSILDDRGEEYDETKELLYLSQVNSGLLEEIWEAVDKTGAMSSEVDNPDLERVSMPR